MPKKTVTSKPAKLIEPIEGKAPARALGASRRDDEETLRPRPPPLLPARHRAIGLELTALTAILLTCYCKTMHGIKWVPIGQLLGLALVIFRASPLPNEAAQFVQLTTEIQMYDWDYQFFYDRDPRHHENPSAPSIFTGNAIRRCVIGASTWMVESTLPTFTETFWFTGTNIIAHTVVTRAASAETAENVSKATKLEVEVPPVGHRYTRIYESVDGNPGRPGGVADLMGFNISSRICWLAFCSAPALKHEGRCIFPPSDQWKESSIFYSGWSDSTKVFQDALSLPMSIDLVSTNGQPIFQYQVRQSTNILGWQIPLEYYGVQYLPTRTNGWKLHLTFKGKVTLIAPATAPEIPSEVMKVVEK